MMKKTKLLLLLGSCCVLGGCFEEAETAADVQVSVSEDSSVIAEDVSIAKMNIGAIDQDTPTIKDPFTGSNLAGQYLASHFAQNRHDWKKAAEYLNEILKITPKQTDLVKKSMILAAGSGDIDTAVALAKQLKEGDEVGALAPLFEFSSIFKSGAYEDAASYIETMPHAGLAEFIYPLITGWTQAALGEYEITDLQSNTVHLKHAILISDFLDQPDRIEGLLVKSASASNISVEEVETIADGFAYIGKIEQAQKLYDQVLLQEPNNKRVAGKISGLAQTPPEIDFHSAKTAEHGMARAIYDIAKLLYQEGSDDSARIFTYLSRYINDENPDSTLLLGTIAAKNKQYDQAISYYSSIERDHESYLDVQRMAADLMERAGHKEKALLALEALYREYDDIRSLIAIGDIHRKNKDFEQAVISYNEAEKALLAREQSNDLDGDFWHLHYVRGMALEQAGDWDAAEEDLKAALKIEPDHPFVLNYLGYAWVDQNMHLEKALSMIEKAVSLQPNDGYIIDSLGWAYYKMGRFPEAISQLERAVELLPYDPTINDHLGDAYWRADRKLEARFQWRRAKNHSEDDALTAQVTEKLRVGLAPLEVIKHAEAQPSADDAAEDKAQQN